MQIFNDPKIQEFMKINNLSNADLIAYIGEIKIYLSDPDKYSITWDGCVEISTKRHEINPGLLYLEEEYFGRFIQMNDVDYKTNPLKANAIKQVLTMEKGYFMQGKNGIGKTFMSVALANHHYSKTSERTLFVFWPDFIEKTKRFNENNGHYINKVKYAKRLIIDDLGQESISQWSRDDILNSIIAFRLEKGLFTAVTSNYSKTELLGLYTLKATESKKARAIISKLDALAPDITFDGRDLRTNKDEN